MTEQELLFFEKYPRMLPVYERLRETIFQAHPGTVVKVSKTQISFRSRYVFAMASLPWRKIRAWPEEYLLVSFGLPEPRSSERIVQCVEAYPNRWTHHVLTTCPAEIDEELLSWLEEAWQFSMIK